MGGPIPNSIGSCTNITIFFAHSNNFYGKIPTYLANFTKLLVLDLSKNGLTRELPQYFTSFQCLEPLILGYNHLHGYIPQHITNLTKLHMLDLSNNKFSGMIPTHLEGLSGFVNVSNNYELHLEIIIDIKGNYYNVSYLLPTNTIFDLSCNNLTGEIPVNIGSMSRLRLLNLSGNQLEGQIPASLSEIPSLEELDLSKNNLSGQIPQVPSKLSMLASLNVSYNHLCRPIPSGTQFSTFNVTYFDKNHCLCGLPLPTCKKNDKPKKTIGGGKSNQTNAKKGLLSYANKKVSLLALSLGLGIGFGRVVVMFIIWDKARSWVMGMPCHKQKPFYGVYRFSK